MMEQNEEEQNDGSSAQRADEDSFAVALKQVSC